jgi:predicted regulator of Ras-like GTPase activity (Roadblock/LC7/MglB family)
MSETNSPDILGALEAESVQVIQGESVALDLERIGAVKAPSRPGLVHLEEKLTGLLTHIADDYWLRALMLASDDGLVIAKARNQGVEPAHEEALAAFAALCDGIGERAVRDSLMETLDEISLRGADQSHLCIRSFKIGPKRFLLIATTRAHAPAQFVTDQALAQCQALLAQSYSENPAPTAPAAPSSWRRCLHRALARLQNSGFFA